MGKEIRKTGIDIIGDVRWGTHLCQFYQTKEDLIDILVPYFKAGLENNEFCMWVTSEPLNEKEAKEAIRKAVPDFDRYLKRGQIEIIPHAKWYLRDDVFDLQRVLSDWVDKLNQALSNGYDGIRVTGNTAWLEKRDWRNFTDYEEAINNVIGKYRMLAICSYSLDRCGASEVVDVVSNHQFALIRREGKWVRIESAERKQAEAALRHSEEQLRLVTDALPVLISYVDSKQYYRFNNKAYEEWFGHPHSEITGRHVKEVLGKAVYQVIQKYFEAALSGQKVTYEGTLPYKDGGARYVIANYVPHFGEGGEVKGFFVVARDITDRKQAEEALRESEEQLRLVTDALPVLISYVDSEQCYCFNNKAYEEWFGHPRSEITGRHVKEVLGEPVYQVTQKYFEAALSGQKVTYEGTMLYKDGGTRYVIANYVPHFGEGGEVKGFFVVVRDITDRKQAEEALRESEEKYRRLFEVSPIGITTIDMKGVITSCNSAVYKEGGYSEDDLVGKHFSKIASLRLRDIPKYMRVFSSIMRGKVPKPFEVTYKRKDGTMGWTEIHLALLKAHGSKLGVQVLQRDITERKQAEEREKRLQQELNLASRLASIGELAAGVAHEINNPLTGIMGFSQRLFRKSTDAKARQDLERIHNEAVRAAKVVKNLLTFARHREPKKRYLNINDILQKALELRAYELKTSNIEVVTNFAPRLPRTMVDFYQMQEVLVNIILNAEQAMTEANRGGELTIKTQKLKDNIRISFTDDGPGIPAEHLDKIFNPFFTTRGRKGGTGLGLSVCHGIVERHGGRIYARSKPGKGTTFFVELPLARVKR